MYLRLTLGSIQLGFLHCGNTERDMVTHRNTICSSFLLRDCCSFKDRTGQTGVDSSPSPPLGFILCIASALRRRSSCAHSHLVSAASTGLRRGDNSPVPHRPDVTVDEEQAERGVRSFRGL
ncbi:hypothetical protein GOODEAATRI_022627 [Goodea atripinnis]|uniref:Arginine vasotocin receptor n=1 Tax=Goodea atripinnis TaxID=208336 RepID=A0ABV0P711_9TELE